jgi:hypothetical protein
VNFYNLPQFQIAIEELLQFETDKHGIEEIITTKFKNKSNLPQFQIAMARIRRVIARGELLYLTAREEENA